jgi:2,5-diamino-6-(ribosylamino)-4(3H)-pyrimidinone 5'-phosphate reductase
MLLPKIILHTVVSIDGRIDWGIGEEGPYYALVGKFGADADLSGSNTILKAAWAEDPQSAFPELYAAWAGKPDRPLLAVVDSQGRVKNWRVIKRQPFWRGFVALCSRSTPQAHLETLREEGVQTITAGEAQVDLRRALEELNERCNVKVVRVDSGGILNGVLLRAGLVSEVSLVVYPGLVGGRSPSSMFVADDLTGPEGVVRAKLAHVEAIDGKYVWMRYTLE